MDGIFVAVRKSEVSRLKALLKDYEINGKVHIVEGGDTRQSSVSNALAAVDGREDDIVLVHDAVRPLIDAATIARTIEAVENTARHRRAACHRYHQTGRTHRPWRNYHFYDSA